MKDKITEIKVMDIFKNADQGKRRNYTRDIA